MGDARIVNSAVKKKSLSDMLFIVMAGWLIFLPISFFIFGLKNDILTDYFPTRFFISEAIRSGSFPWWNPYVNFGVPQYADMNSGFWNPITWFFAALGYNIYTITMELMTYIILGGIGMYFLGIRWGWGRVAAMSSAFCYMGSGFITGHVQHLNWISSAGFLPWCILMLHLVLENRRYVIAGALVFYLFFSSAHPSMMIGGFYFFLLAAIHLLSLTTSRRPALMNIILMGALTLAMSIGLLYSYFEVLPYTLHVNKPEVTAFNATTWKCWISLLFPFTINSNKITFGNDPALRNLYMGTMPILLLASAIVQRQKVKWFWLVAGAFFLLMASDLAVSLYIRKMLPLTEYVRLNAAFRLFGIFSLLVAAFSRLDSIPSRSFQRSALVLSAFYSVLFAYVVIAAGKRLLTASEMSFNPRGALNLFTDFNFAIVVQILFSLFIIAMMTLALEKRGFSLMLLICLVDMVVSANIQLPFTGYGVKSPAELQAMVDRSPEGIPKPALVPLKKIDRGNEEITKTIGHWSLYNKQPGTLQRAGQPLIFKTEFSIFSDSSIKKLANHPFVFCISGDGKGVVSIPDIAFFSANKLVLDLSACKGGIVNVLYKRYPGWEYSFDHETYRKIDWTSDFISIPLPKTGAQQISIRFRPTHINILFMACMGMFLLGILHILSHAIYQFVKEPQSAVQ